MLDWRPDFVFALFTVRGELGRVSLAFRFSLLRVCATIVDVVKL